MTNGITGTIGRKSWGQRLSRGAFWLSLAGLVIALGGAFAAGADIIGKLAGLSSLGAGAMAALLGGVLALVAVIIHMRRGSGSTRHIMLALLLAAPLLGYVGYFFKTASGLPPIHDVTTNLDNPPTFAKLALRADNLDMVPDRGRADLQSLAPVDRWKTLHREAYADIKPLSVQSDVAATVDKIAAQAKARGWDVALVDKAAGRVEATERVSLYKFADDIVFIVTPDPANPAQSVVNARSVSRIGIGDVGVNARRIR
ncbi:MAG: hypothetical protein RLZZ58_1663, partial [Pseudomonadota bacterium]